MSRVHRSAHHSVHRSLIATGLMVACCSCTSRPGASTGSGTPWAAPPLERATRVFDTRNRREISFAAMLEQLARADVVFLGETHLDETTHRVEWALYEGLIARRPGQVVLAMEMFERDDQQALDDYLAGKLEEPEFLERASPWQNYRTAYRPLIETARREGLPVIGSNAPTVLRRKVAMGGKEGLEQLTEAQRALLPAQLLAHTPEYWARVDNAVRGHLQMLGSRDPVDRLYSTQSLWDNSMAEACATAIDDHPGRLVLHVNGAFHSSRWDGTVRQLRLRRPGLKVKTVSVRPTASLATAGSSGAEQLSDFYILAASRARDVSDHFHAVTVHKELKYRLHMPDGATDEHKVPLLIWLCDDGFSARDGLRLWKQRLGDQVAIAAIEPIYPERQEDLERGGRWFWPETFDEDLGLLETGLDRAWGYLLRNQPIDPQAVVLAGEGTGATVVAFASLNAGRIESRSVAVRPRHFSKLRNFPLPLALGDELEPGPKRELLVITDEASEEWWQQELSDYARSGLTDELLLTSKDAWRQYQQVEQALGVRLGLSVPAPDSARTRRHIILDTETPRARLWARIYALSASGPQTDVAIFGDSGEPVDSNGSSRLPLELSPLSFQEGKRLPLAPGPFGGTTVLVLPDGLDPLLAESWRQIEEDQSLNKQFRFHRLRVATEKGPGGIDAVLAKLKSEGRKNVLLVPALFCADPETMRRLRTETSAHSEEMTLHWQPGLGANLKPIAGKTAETDAPSGR